MSDETKAGVVSLIWLGVFAVFVAEPSVIRGLLVAFTTVIEAMYCKHDAEREQLRRSRQRYADHADSEIRSNTAAPCEELPEERVKRIIGGFR